MSDAVREVQKYGAEALKIFAEVCEENHFTYFMIGGTLLGAVRHKGYIPWDDDIDLAMPRKDYEKLLSMSDQLNIGSYYFDHYKKNDSMLRAMIMVLKDRSVKVDYLHDNNFIEHSDLKIDILPIDGTPNNKIVRQIFYLKLLVYRAIFKFTVIEEVNMDNLDKNRPFIERFLIIFARITKVGKHVDGRKILDKLEVLLKSYDMHNSNICGTFHGAYKLREFVDSKYFLNRRKYNFEGVEYYGPEDYDGYLKCIYGDYMKLPPVERRKGKHKIIRAEKYNFE